MNLSNKLKRIRTIIPHPQNVSIRYLILNLNDGFQLSDKQEHVINLQR
jgi:hypothetical protein